MPSQSTLLGAAGEHYVLCQLLRRGYIAALAPLGVPNADILITDTEGQRLIAIQVKTRRNIGSDKGWHMKPSLSSWQESRRPARLHPGSQTGNRKRNDWRDWADLCQAKVRKLMVSENKFVTTEELDLTTNQLLGLINGLKPYYSRSPNVRLLSKKLDQALTSVVVFTSDELERIGLLVLRTLKKRKEKS